MRRFILILATAALAVAPATASAQSTGQTIPVPDPILTKLGKTPMVELWDGGGGLPYLGATAPYNAGDWEGALRTYHDSGVYDRQLAKVDRVAAQWLRRAGGFKKVHFKKKWNHRSARRALIALGHGDRHRHHGKRKKLAMVFDIGPEDDHGTTVDYKSGARAAIEDEGYKIVANVGDQYSDLAGGHSQIVFKLPNPFYFLP